MGYRNSTPTHVVLAETKLPSLKDLTLFSGTRYIVKVLTNSLHPFNQILQGVLEAYNCNQVQAPPSTSRDRPLIRSLQLIWKYQTQILPLPNFPGCCTDYSVQIEAPLINLEMAEVNTTEAYNTIFQETVNTKFQEHIIIYTDGSKILNNPAVGAACVSPQLSYVETRTLPGTASVFTAECVGLEMAVQLANQNRQSSYLICTDSLSLLQALRGTKLHPSTNQHFIGIKKGLKSFRENSKEHNITLMWVPAHSGITGNEQADNAAKGATLQTQHQIDTLPIKDILQNINNTIWQIIDTHWKEKQLHCGTKYFLTYYNSSKKPWYNNLQLPRRLTVMVNRARANHYNLAASLSRIHYVWDAACTCGAPWQDLDHILWQCPLYTQSRKTLSDKLRLYRRNPPYKVTIFLEQPQKNIQALKAIDSFLDNCSLRI